MTLHGWGWTENAEQGVFFNSAGVGDVASEICDIFYFRGQVRGSLVPAGCAAMAFWISPFRERIDRTANLWSTGFAASWRFAESFGGQIFAISKNFILGLNKDPKISANLG